jgi:predicted PurR-regulated permease PerM
MRDRGAPAATAEDPETGVAGPGNGDARLHAGHAPAAAAEAGPRSAEAGSRSAVAGSRSAEAGSRTMEADPRPTEAGPPPADGGARTGPARPHAEPRVPGWLERAAGWAWRLIILGVLIYLTFRVISVLRLVVLPCVAALLLTALLQPLTQRLRQAGLPALAATWCTFLAALAVLAGVVVLAATRTSADYQRLVTDVGNTSDDLQRWLAGPPFHLHRAGLEHLSNRFVTFLKQHQSEVAGTVVSGGRIFLEVVAGLVLTLFVTFFLLKDGDRIWAWLTSFFGDEPRARTRRAGSAAWQALTWYVRGTVAVAAIHAVVIGTTLWIMGVPLLVPLVVLVFVAAFVPLVGILVAGTLAVAVTLATRGWVAALVLVAIFILENQLEGHLLQPLVVGRLVRFHPLAIILVLAVGGVAGGIAGAVVAVPLAVALFRALPYLLGRADGADPPGALARPGYEQLPK